MKTKGVSYKDFALKLLKRSDCKVQVAAVLADEKGIHAWGWNSSGEDGFGEHAETHCLKRANPKRVAKSVLWVVAQRKKSGNPVSARPCMACWPAVKQVCYVIYRKKDGYWAVLHTGQRGAEQVEERNKV